MNKYVWILTGWVIVGVCGQGLAEPATAPATTGQPPAKVEAAATNAPAGTNAPVTAPAVVPAAAPAADVPAGPRVASVTGVVRVMTDSSNAPTGIEVMDKLNRIFHITLDAEGKKLVDLKEKRATVTGTIAVKDGKRWVTVTAARLATEDMKLK